MEGMTKNCYQVVMDRMKQIKQDIGDGNALDHYKRLRGQDNLGFALQLNVVRRAAVMTATEHHGRDVTQSSSIVAGRVPEAHVACEGPP